MRRYRRLKLVAVVGLAVTVLTAGGATAGPSGPTVPFLPPAGLAEPLEWANPTTSAPASGGVTPKVARIALGNFDRPAAGVKALSGTLDDVPLAERYRRASKARSLVITRSGLASFSAVGVTWRETGQVGAVSVAVRRHVPGGGWSIWRAVGPGELNRDPSPAPEGTAVLRGGAEFIWLGPADGLQLSVTTLGGAVPHDLAADLIDPLDAPGDAAETATATESAPLGVRLVMPPINRRAAWGANEQQMNWRPQYAPYVKAVVLHHTATGNYYSPTDVPKILRAIYQYQTVSRGWGDIGYNVLVDRFGRLWEGRSGGLARPVVGAQAGGFNTGTAGIAMIGDYRATTVPPAVVESSAQYTAWKLSLNQAIDPRGSVSLTGGGSTSRYPVGTTVTVPRVFPHRQTNPTECPGDRGMDVLPTIRNRAADLLGNLVKPDTVRTVMATYRPSDGTIRLPGEVQPIFTTGPNEIPAPADFNGDGTTDPATWSPRTGNWTMQLSGEGPATAQWGLPGDVPVPADFNGDGHAELTVYRPATGLWYIRGIGEIQFGMNGDVPVPGDYTGDGHAEPAIWRPSTGLWAIYAIREFQFGAPGEIPVPADYNGDGVMDPATWSPTTQQFTLTGQSKFRLGEPGDTPVSGQYDGDGRADPAVFHAGRFDIRGVGSYDAGVPGDIPMPLG